MGDLYGGLLCFLEQFNMFINDLDDRVEYKLITYAVGVKLGRIANMIGARIRIQNDLDNVANKTKT